MREKNELIINGRVYETTIHEEDIDRQRQILLLGLGTSYRLKNNTEIYSNFSQNYKSITFSDLRVTNPSFAVDPNLKDERGFNFDIGIRGLAAKYFRYDGSLYLLGYYDRIGEVLEWSEQLKKSVRVRTNVADSRNIGMELLMEWQALKMLTGGTSKHDVNLFGNFSVTDAQYTTSSRPGIDGKEVELVPPYTIKTGINYKYKNFSASYLYSFVKSHYTDASNSEESNDGVTGLIPSYWVMDLSLAYNWKKLRFETGVNNLTDNTYFTRRATAYPGPGIIPAGSRSFYFTLQLKI